MKYFKIRVTTDAREESVTQKDDDTFYIVVKEPAKENRANRRVIELLKEHLSIERGRLSIIAGHHHPHKIIGLREHEHENNT